MTALAHHSHPVAVAVASARAVLGEVAGVPVWSMTGDQTTKTLADLEALEAQTAATKARLLRHAESIDLPAENGARNVASWLARRHRLTRREAHRQRFLAEALAAHPGVETALDSGLVNTEQAHAILRGLDGLPEDLDPGLKTEAEEHLIGLARDFDAKALKNLGRTILEVVAPDLADQHLAQQLDKEERDATAAARFSMWEDGHGKVHGRFTLDAFTGACLTKALSALAAPKHRAAKDPSENDARHRNDSARPSPSTSSATPPPSSRTPADSTPPSSS